MASFENPYVLYDEHVYLPVSHTWDNNQGCEGRQRCKSGFTGRKDQWQWWDLRGPTLIGNCDALEGQGCSLSRALYSQENTFC